MAGHPWLVGLVRSPAFPAHLHPGRTDKDPVSRSWPRRRQEPIWRGLAPCVLGGGPVVFHDMGIVGPKLAVSAREMKGGAVH